MSRIQAFKHICLTTQTYSCVATHVGLEHTILLLLYTKAKRKCVSNPELELLAFVCKCLARKNNTQWRKTRGNKMRYTDTHKIVHVSDALPQYRLKCGGAHSIRRCGDNEKLPIYMISALMRSEQIDVLIQTYRFSVFHIQPASRIQHNVDKINIRNSLLWNMNDKLKSEWNTQNRFWSQLTGQENTHSRCHSHKVAQRSKSASTQVHVAPK